MPAPAKTLIISRSLTTLCTIFNVTVPSPLGIVVTLLPSWLAILLASSVLHLIFTYWLTSNLRFDKVSPATPAKAPRPADFATVSGLLSRFGIQNLRT